MGNPIKESKIYKIILNKWRGLYCIILPIASVVVYFACYKKFDIKVWNSENFSDTLTSMVTFVSIIISFFGVLLPLLISAKEKSKLVSHFLDSVDKEFFVSSIKKLIMYGLFTVIITAVLFMNDIMAEKVVLFFFCVEIFSLIKFLTLTYRFANILISLLVKDMAEKKEGAKLPEDKKREMDERIRKGI